MPRDMKQTACPRARSSAINLLDLPASWLHDIASFMDKKTKRQFFRTSKGSQEEPGCAVLVLRASKLKCRLECSITFEDWMFDTQPHLPQWLHWAAQISTDMELELEAYDLCLKAHKRYERFELLEILYSLLLYPDARATPTGYIRGKPATYPGITSLVLVKYVSSSLIPSLVADAFPNLKSLVAIWMPATSRPPAPMLHQGLSSLQHIEVGFKEDDTSDDDDDDDNSSWPPAINEHIAQHVSQSPSLISIDVKQCMFQAMPAAALAKLKTVKLCADGAPTAKDEAALKACSQLDNLELYGPRAQPWVQALLVHVPSISTLYASIHMADKHVAALLALPHLTSLTVDTLSKLSDDYSTAPCNWQQLEYTGSCSNYITKLPLHTLDDPITCKRFTFILSDHAADLAAIRAAKPHLLRCGGIEIDRDLLQIANPSGRALTKDQVAEVLAEWAPCLPVPSSIDCCASLRRIIESALAQLWPAAKVD